MNTDEARQERRRKTGRESQQRFRERKIEAAVAREARGLEVAKYGEARVAARDTANSFANLAICLGLYFNGTLEKRALAKIESDIDGILIAMEEWLSGYRSDVALDNFWDWCVRVGEFEANPIQRFRKLLEARGQNQLAPVVEAPAVAGPISRE